jgi:acetyl esterase/lipase
VTSFIRLFVAILLLAAALIAVIPPQTYTMWQLSVAAAEWGHFIAIAALLLIVIPGWRSNASGKLAVIVSVIAMMVALTPLVRAVPVASKLPKRISAAFGSGEPRSLPGANPMMKPLSAARLFSRPRNPEVGISTMVFTDREGTPLELDLYRREDAPVPLPIVVTIYGGSWRGGTKGDIPQLNYYLAARGYGVAAISYRFAPAHPFPAQTDDVNAAIDYLKSNAARLRLDSSRIVLIGRSAGGQLALQSAYRKNDPAIKGAVSFYGPTDQKWGWDHPTNQRVYKSFITLRDFMHGDPATAADAYRESSPLNFVNPQTVPTLMIHGGMDPLVSVRQSQRLDSALAAARRPHLLIDMPWATHGCDYVSGGPCWQESTYAVERFLAAVMK